MNLELPETPASNRVPPKPLSLLRSRVAAVLWLGVTAYLCLQLWQAVVGWPIVHRSPVTFPTETKPGSDLLEGRIKTTFYRVPWNAPLARLEADGQRLPQYSTAEALRGAPASGFWIRGHTVYVRLGGRDPASSQLPTCLAELPWHTSIAEMLSWTLLFLLLTGALAWSRHPLFGHLGRLASRMPWVPVLFVLVLLAAVFCRMAGLSFPVWENDTMDYIRPALQFNAGVEVEPSERSLGYAFVLGFLLRLFDDLRSIVVAHQAASILTGIAIAAVLQAASFRLFPAGPLRLLTQLLGVLGMAGFTLHEAILEREWSILPEAWTAIYMAAQLALGWRLTTRPPRLGRFCAEYAVFCLLGWGLFLSRPNWGLALGCLPFPVVTTALLRPAAWRGLALGGSGVCAATAALSYGLISLTPANTAKALETRAKVLVCWHIELVRPEIDRRLAESPSDHDRALLQELAAALDEERALSKSKGPGGYPILGHDGDRLFYFGLRKARLFQHAPPAEQIALCSGLFRDAVRHAPWLYARKVARQMVKPLQHPYGPALIYLPNILESLGHSEAIARHPPEYLSESLRSKLERALAQPRAVLTGPWPSPARAELSLQIGTVFQWLSVLLGWALGLPMLLTLAAACWPAWRRVVPWRQLAPVLSAGLWAVGSAVGSALTSSLAQACEVQRYIDFFMPLTLFAELLWPLIGLSIVLALKPHFSRDGGVPAASFSHSSAKVRV